MVQNILCDIKTTSFHKLGGDRVSAAKRASQQTSERASEAGIEEQANELTW